MRLEPALALDHTRADCILLEELRLAPTISLGTYFDRYVVHVQLKDTPSADIQVSSHDGVLSIVCATDRADGTGPAHRVTYNIGLPPDADNERFVRNFIGGYLQITVRRFDVA